MTDLELKGRRAVVTGGASGIGLACARELAGRGAHVVIADLDGAAAEAVAAELGGEAWTVDLADTIALDDLSLEADILVNNAGIQRVNPIPEFDPEEFRLIQRLMVESPFLLIRASTYMANTEALWCSFVCSSRTSATTPTRRSCSKAPNTQFAFDCSKRVTNADAGRFVSSRYELPNEAGDSRRPRRRSRRKTSASAGKRRRMIMLLPNVKDEPRPQRA